MSGEYPELLADLAQHVEHQLCERGVAAQHAKECGFAAAEHIRKHWAGMQIYIPFGRGRQISERDEEIWRKFNGHNHNELVREYELSLQTIYHILKEVGAAKRAQSQPDMFKPEGVIPSAQTQDQ